MASDIEKLSSEIMRILFIATVDQAEGYSPSLYCKILTNRIEDLFNYKLD